jgi:hypothetical protein
MHHVEMKGGGTKYMFLELFECCDTMCKLNIRIKSPLRVLAAVFVWNFFTTCHFCSATSIGLCVHGILEHETWLNFLSSLQKNSVA